MQLLYRLVAKHNQDIISMHHWKQQNQLQWLEEWDLEQKWDDSSILGNYVHTDHPFQILLIFELTELKVRQLVKNAPQIDYNTRLDPRNFGF